LPYRARALAALFAAALVPGLVPGLQPSPVAAAGPKVAIVVGPVGSLTSTYRSYANEVAAAATAAGATVVKAYSPRATWGRVRDAVSGANVIVYFGHGNGSPNPYSGSTELTDRVNGWGLNRTTGNGDADNWSSTLVYCGEKALLGTLSSSDGAAQRQYCGGTASGGVHPAPGFTMVYAQAHYAPGFGERYDEDDPLTTLDQARQRVRNYSYPGLALGAGAVVATAYGDADDIVTRVLTQPARSYGEIFRDGRGYNASALRTMAHPDVAGAEVWVQKTRIAGFHFGQGDYWYAFAGDPARAPADGAAFTTHPFTDSAGSKFHEAIAWVHDLGLMAGCTDAEFCPKSFLTRGALAEALANGLGLPATENDYYPDDENSVYEDAINRLTAAGLTRGCGDGDYCPGQAVRRGQLATALAWALNLPPATVDHFTDDTGNRHEPNINRIAEAGITTGCGDGRFCLDYRLRRAQGAAFVRNSFD
jgi:hypothetical protein